MEMYCWNTTKRGQQRHVLQIDSLIEKKWVSIIWGTKKRSKKGGKWRFLERTTTMSPSQGTLAVLCWDFQVLILNIFHLSSHVQQPTGRASTSQTWAALRFQTPPKQKKCLSLANCLAFSAQLPHTLLWNELITRAAVLEGRAEGPPRQQSVPVLQLSWCHSMFV